MPDFSATLQSALGPGYALERELTGGGMSRVFLATDTALTRKVVVKVLPPELAAGVNHDRFRREIQVAAQLQHPHIVPLLSAGEQGALIWYTMPYISGESLREALARRQAFTVREVVRILHDVADALSYAHGLGVIHRDIKPGNVLVLGNHALVTDFGVAKAISASMPTSGFTSAGMAIGTPAYMAPEQIAADPAADHRVDLYALGLLAYELLTGDAPFKEDSPQKTMAAQLTRDPSPVDTRRADVPAELSALVRRLLAKQPEDRPQLAAEVVAVLDDLTLSVGGTLAATRPTRRPSRMRALGIATVGVTVVAAAWLLGERQGTAAVATVVRDPVAAAEANPALASAAALLTRDDSLAIARAVSARMAERAPTPRQTMSVDLVRAESLALVRLADSLRAQFQRTVLDSFVLLGARQAAPAAAAAVSEALSATAAALEPGRGQPRRVIVAQPRGVRGRPELEAIVTLLSDSLRHALDAHPRYAVVSPDSVSLALGQSRTMNALQERLDADLLVSIALVPGADSITRIITIRDISEPTGVSMRVITSKVTAAAPGAGVGSLVPQVVRALVELERGPRVRSVGPAGAPTAQRPPTGPRPPRP
ncbi:MAG: serine/threonine protein kinase [Gemmatimonadales bacterium]|nr:serine/threonine protein kinase [Gemmatimonadales bacterium]